MSNKHIEIERKFLVNGEFKSFVTKSYRIAQGYLCADSVRTVRVRTKGEKGYLTIKGATNENGFSRFEWEKEIPLNDYFMEHDFTFIWNRGSIYKTRYQQFCQELIHQSSLDAGF